MPVLFPTWAVLYIKGACCSERMLNVPFTLHTSKPFELKQLLFQLPPTELQKPTALSLDEVIMRHEICHHLAFAFMLRTILARFKSYLVSAAVQPTLMVDDYLLVTAGHQI